MIIKKSNIDGKILTLNYEPQKVINNPIFCSYFILDLNVKLLQENILVDKARLNILFV